jgi:predicted TPR repeat methyltransferase
MNEPPDVPREITLDEAVSIAMRCHQREQFDEADAIYRRILEVAPDRADAVHYSGVLAHQRGRSDEAVALIDRSLTLEPSRSDWHSNLGIVLQERGDLDGAVGAYRRAIALDAGHANAHSNLGVLLRAQGKNQEAEEAYRAAIELNPAHADAHQNLAVLLSATGRVAEAVQSYCRALTLKPGYPEARRLLALAYCIIDEREKAIVLCEEWVKQEPDDPAARHTLAACSGRDVPIRAADAYVERTFDSFSETFEAKLAQLHYRAPALVADAVAACGLTPAKSLDIADAGCGTGLCGPLLAPYARRLHGVDLSAGMLARAAGKQVYDELEKGELTAYLAARPEAFDLVVSADTLVYFGALDAVVQAAAAALRPGGHLIFTVEEALAGDGTATYTLQPHGRYTHRLEYVEQVLVGAGLHPGVSRAELRLERGIPVNGLVVRAAKPLAAVGARAAERPENSAVTAIGDDRG